MRTPASMFCTAILAVIPGLLVLLLALGVFKSFLRHDHGDGDGMSREQVAFFERTGIPKPVLRDVDWSEYEWFYSDGVDFIDVKVPDGKTFVEDLKNGDVVVFPYRDGKRLMMVSGVTDLEENGRHYFIGGYRRVLYENLYYILEELFSEELE